MTVIVRTKDRPYFLARALADIAAQTVSDAEVIVVNDGGDAAEVMRIVDKSSIADRTRAIEMPGAGGRCAAANAGIRASTTDYVVLHDDDDRWHPEFLAKTSALLDASSADAGVMVATEIVYETQRGREWVEEGRAPFWQGMTDVTFLALLEVNRAVPISFLYRRSLHEELGFYDETLDAVEDWEFYLRVTAAHPVAFLGGTPLAYWTQRPDARGAAGNSMYELSTQHERDDMKVRDRELRRWVEANGPGLPLYMAQLHRDAERQLADRLDQVAGDVIRGVYDAHPFWRRVRRLLRTRRR
ncbi:glycosyltransferase family A protein [Microbacterium sp.]|uniref:glycosyltransferase family 2 protein n=1 Tax=Microbacterium sp. TaxID=51671 RepID=UPI0025F9A8AC|nr:glycosyltransferase family A protein [Microbacterium sp.]